MKCTEQSFTDLMQQMMASTRRGNTMIQIRMGMITCRGLAEIQYTTVQTVYSTVQCTVTVQ